MAFEIIYSDEAKKNLDTITSWLLYERLAGETALLWPEGLREKIDTLSEWPDRCPLALESKSLPFEMRQLLYGRKPRIYRILFAIDGNTVHILYIRRPGEKLVPLN
jgi:plasmid stabilization system protein ParE